MISLEDLHSFNDHQDMELNLQALEKLGGLKGVAKKLKSNLDEGLHEKDDLEERAAFFGTNTVPQPPTKSLVELFIETFDDQTVIILIISAVVSLIVGLYENLATGWIEGTAILVAVLIVAVVTACNNYVKEKQFQKLNAQKDDVNIPTLRNGRIISLPTRHLLVGDVIELNAGDKVPCDGIVINGSDIACDESALTGESDERTKMPAIEGETKGDPFLLSGTTLQTGNCFMLVCAVGMQSRWGRIKSELAMEEVDTPLQEKLTVLADNIGYGGMVAAAGTFVAMLAMFYINDNQSPDTTVFDVALKAFIMAVTIVVVAVPEGLPLAVTLSLAFSTQKMMQDNNLIRVLAACETMGNATNICSDKTGTLTQNKMTVVETWIGGKHEANDSTYEYLSAKAVDLISEGISVNTTAALLCDDGGSPPEVIGNKTEGALLLLLRNKFNMDYVPLRAKGFQPTRGDKLATFTSKRKCMSVVQSLPSMSRLFTKGAAEVILAKCTKYMNAKGEEVDMKSDMANTLEETIETMASKSLRVLALAHRDISKESVGRVTRSGACDKKTPQSVEEMESDLTLDAIVGIKDPLRPDVRQAVEKCQHAGIMVRMVTGDNIKTAKAIATECGIYTDGGLVMEGPEFRKLTPAELDKKLPFLQVLARSSPDDKLTLVSRLNGHNLPTNEEEWLLQHPGMDWNTDRDHLLPGYRQEWEESRARVGAVAEVVGVTGDGTNDGPALRAADVGLSMGLSGTDVAKDASDIVILDDNFSSIVKAVLWGRSVFDNIRKFLQFQLSVNVVALTVTFVSAVTGFNPPLNAVMMLWVNLIMDTMGALALGTEPPCESLLQRLPYRRDASLISGVMWKHVLIQSFFQIAILAYVLLVGAEQFGVEEGSVEHFTVVFNVFVFCQVFNEFNARSITSSPDIFKGLFHNPIFLCIILFTVITQYALVQYGGEFVHTVPLNQSQWEKSVILGALSLPAGAVMRLVPLSESASSFAAVPEILAKHIKTVSGDNGSGGSQGSSLGKMSLLVWVVVVTTIPALVYQHFGDDIEKLIEKYFHS